MEIHQLEYVVAVAKHKSFTQAARAINSSQSSLSQQINKLEKELGIKIFERTTRRVNITPAGAEFINHALRILSEVNQAQRTVQEYLSTNRGHIKIGLIPVSSHYGLTVQIAEFQKNYPRIKLDFIEYECENLQKMLLDGKIDIGFFSETEPDPRIRMIRLLNDKLILVTNNLHPLATQGSVSLADLANEKFIIPSPESGLYVNFLQACRNAGFEPKILYQCTQVETILDFLCHGLGVTLLSTAVASRYMHYDISMVSIVPTIRRRISLAVLKESKMSPALNVFIKFFQNRKKP